MKKDNDGMTFFTGIILHLGDGLTGRVATPIRRILALMFEHPEMLTIIVRDSQRMNVMVKGRPPDVIAWFAQHASSRKTQQLLRFATVQKIRSSLAEWHIGSLGSES